MAAATADRDVQRSEGRELVYPVDGGALLYKGTLAGVNGDGHLAEMAHGTAGLAFAGVTQERADNSDGADGAATCRVVTEGAFNFAYGGGDAAQGLVGSVAYAVDDQTVDEDPATVTNEYAVGVIVEVVSAGVVRVKIDGFPQQLSARGAAQAAIVSLTDNSGGAADNTIAAITNAANAGSADVAPTANAIADLAAKVNAILAALRGAGIIAQ